MKKSNLVIGTGCAIAGVIFLLLALLLDSRLDSLFFGFAGGGIGAGGGMIFRYFYWNRPENRTRYQEKAENEMIDLHDELKEKLRDQAGRYTYLLGLVVSCTSIVVFSILGQLQVLGEAQTIILYLGAYIVFQLVAGNRIYHHLLKRY